MRFRSRMSHLDDKAWFSHNQYVWWDCGVLFITGSSSDFQKFFRGFDTEAG